MSAVAKQDLARTKSQDVAYMGKLRGNTCSSNQSQVWGVWEMESMNARTQERLPSGGDQREPQRPDS